MSRLPKGCKRVVIEPGILESGIWVVSLFRLLNRDLKSTCPIPLDRVLEERMDILDLGPFGGIELYRTAQGSAFLFELLGL
jgi:hypothetical protein